VIIDAYVRNVGSQLARLGPLATGSLLEIREHLLESAQNLIEGGATPDEAEREAVRRFGDPHEVAAELTAVLRQARDPVERILKIISITNLFVAVWGLATVVLLNPTAELLCATGLMSAASIAAALAFMRRDVEPGTLAVTSVALIAVGLAGIFWALIGDRAGGAELGLALLMGLYPVQGALALWASARRQALVAELPGAA
jgi:hypothetical protein